jgi:hypothetical protein
MEWKPHHFYYTIGALLTVSVISLFVSMKQPLYAPPVAQTPKEEKK